jgi:hypothetical protein
MKTRHLLLLALLAAALVAACHDKVAPEGNGGGPSEGEGEGDGGEGEGEGIPDLPDDVLAVLVVVPDQIIGEVFAKQQISANLFSSRGDRLPNIPIRFEITSPNPGEAKLKVQEVSTDESGQALNEIDLGSQDGELNLHVSSPVAGVDPVDVRVIVQPRPTGKLEVSFDGVGPARIGPVWVFVMPGNNRCPYNPVVEPFGWLAQAQVAEFIVEQSPHGPIGFNPIIGIKKEILVEINPGPPMPPAGMKRDIDRDLRHSAHSFHFSKLKALG